MRPCLTAMVLIPAQPAAAASTPISASFEIQAQVDDQFPYQPPDIGEVDPPAWAEPFKSLARLPLWGRPSSRPP